MNSAAGDQPAAGSRLLRVLLALALLLVLLIAAGTVYGLASGSRARAQDRAASLAAAAPGSAVFSRIGRVRASTVDEPPAIVIASPAFPYPAADSAFGEELFRKTAALRAAALSWFSRRTEAELHPSLEGAVKAGLREAWNGLLSLGKVEEVWMADYTVIR